MEQIDPVVAPPSLADQLITKFAASSPTREFDMAEFIDDLVPFTPKDLAQLFVNAAIQKSVLQITPGKSAERAQAAILAKLLKTLISYIQIEDDDTVKTILRLTMCEMDRNIRENDLLGKNPEVMYRAFDQMDELLGIQYSLDENMASTLEQKERLYEGAGIGVQTSYSSILLALDRAKPKNNAKVFDLGSGYGRVGFVLGLLRPDIDFVGYEYVDHRVKDSKDVAELAGLTHTKFVTQDLAKDDFQIPLADIYYMYDPFSRETYAKVLNQLIAHGRTNAVTIITKGRANDWVRDALMNQGWSADTTIDGGTVHMFQSETLKPAMTAPSAN